MIATLYRAGAALAAPLVPLYLDRRVAAGREDPARLGERYGRASMPRPAGQLVWLHGASVGESLSLLPLIEALGRRHPGLSFLVTSGTVTSATLLADRLAKQAAHQYLPLDRVGYVRRFLAHWRPACGIFAESALWPNLIVEARRRRLPLALVNARMSVRSVARWRRARGWVRELLAAFEPLLAPDEIQAARYRQFGAAVAVTGNLKSAAPPLGCDAAELARFQAAIAGRPVLLFASTHLGEETIAAALHRALAPDIAELLTMVAPRHPARADAVAADLVQIGFRIARRSKGALPDRSTELYLADSLGELGLFFRLADLVVMGGSFTAVGGHNPLEPAQLARAILSGPGTANFAEIYRQLEAAGGCRVLPDVAALGHAAGALFADPPAREAMAAAAFAFAEAEATVIDRVMAALGPFVERALAQDRA